MVTGDSQEEMMIFRYRQIELHHNIYIISIIIILILQDQPQKHGPLLNPEVIPFARESLLPRRDIQIQIEQ